MTRGVRLRRLGWSRRLRAGVGRLGVGLLVGGGVRAGFGKVVPCVVRVAVAWGEVAVSSVETVTILFTDLVGSTGLESRIGPAAAHELRGEHFALLRQVIGEADGREGEEHGVRSDGGVCQCGGGRFLRGVDSAGLCELNRSADEQLLVKVGVSLGDATAEDGDYFGVPVIEAARLCDRCSGGQVLAKELVAHLAAGRGHSFKGVGALELQGVAGAVGAVEVVWEPLGVEAGSVPLPPRLQGVPPGGFVGRAVEVELLRQLLAQASGGERRLASLSGEPGIGKTRLSTHLALEAHAKGAAVLYGRCDEELGVPYGPWGRGAFTLRRACARGCVERSCGAAWW